MAVRITIDFDHTDDLVNVMQAFQAKSVQPVVPETPAVAHTIVTEQPKQLTTGAKQPSGLRTFDTTPPDPDVFEATARRWPEVWYKLSAKTTLMSMSACATGLRNRNKQLPEADLRVLYTTARFQLMEKQGKL
jgi:hypothetical protein